MRDVLNGAMLMGADVTHPSPEQKTIPSVAAVSCKQETVLLTCQPKILTRLACKIHAGIVMAASC